MQELVYFRKLCHKLKISQEQLDELVCEACMQTLAGLNEAPTKKQQDAIIHNGEAKASSINNEGVMGQLQFLYTIWGTSFLTIQLQRQNL